MSNAEFLHVLWEAAVAAALPDGKFAGRLPARPRGRTLILGAGKAAARMARAFEEVWGPCEGLVVTRYGHAVPTTYVEVVEAAHPVPDRAGIKAADRILALARSAGADDLVVCLVSGGASALLTRPVDGVSLADKQALNKALLRSGAPIGDMNVVRTCLSAVKGGQLALAAAPARVVTYLISDVPGDDPATIGSGPTVVGEADPTRALAILAAHAIDVAPHVAAAIRASASRPRLRAEQAGPVHMLATPMMALQAAASAARDHGLVPLILGDAIEGEAREVGTVLGGIARAVATHGMPLSRPCVLLSGGETTVTLRGKGRGGRNSEFLLSLLRATAGLPGVAALAGDTDGIDGVEDNAGAWFEDATLARAAERGLMPAAFLENNDAYTFFDALGLLVRSGPTHTNVNDFRAILIR